MHTCSESWLQAAEGFRSVIYGAGGSSAGLDVMSDTALDPSRLLIWSDCHCLSDGAVCH